MGREKDLFKTGRFTRSQRIKHSEEINKLFKTGSRVNVAGAKLFFMKNEINKNRIAFTLPRNYGTAVQRNYSKRISRESYRQIQQKLIEGYDMLLLVYPGNDDFSYRCSQMNFLYKKAGLFKV